MRIGIDCRLAGEAHAGIGRYAAQLVKSLLESDTNHHWVLFFFSRKQADEVVPKSFRSGDRVTVRIVAVPHYSLREQLLLPSIFTKEKLDILHVPHFNVPIFYPGKFVLTIHDLLWHSQRGNAVTTLSQLQYWLKYGFYRLVVSVGLRRAKKIFVPTMAVQDSVVALAPYSKNKILVTYEGVDNSFLNDGKPDMAREKRDEFSLLFVGSLYPHKNVRLVIDTLKELPHVQLRLASARSVFQEDILEYAKNMGVSSRVKYLGRLSDAELRKEYRGVSAVIMPSLSEGFGLPGIEALSLGTPLIASDIPVFKEVYQDNATYFDPKNTSSLSRAIEKLRATSSSEAKEKAAAAQEFVKRYSWREMAQTILKHYAQT